MDRVCKKLIELEKINKNYGFLKVLEGVSLHLFEGEIVSILGPSGCGKTTILNIIAGLILPDKGKAWVAKDKRVGYVFQEPRLIPWKNVEQNILFVQKSYSSTEGTARKIREKLIYQAGMTDFVHCFPSELSGGMKQRVSLIRALSIIPHILLLDEPFKSMDHKTVSVIEEIILQMWEKEHQGILMVTHNYKEAMRLSNRVYILSQRPATVVKELPIPVLEPTEFFLPQLSYSAYFSNQGLERNLGLPVKINFRRKHMKLKKIINSLKLQNLTPELDTDVVITGCHISDVISDALANASEGNLWITRQSHQGVIALASLKRIPAILLVNGKKPVPEMVKKAKKGGIVVLTTSMPCFEVAGRLYQLGLSGKKTTTKITGLN